MSEATNEKIFSGMIWKLAEKFGGQAVSFFAQIILARILMPEDYGVIAVITVFIALSDVFIREGFTTALIQRKEVTQKALSTVFFANLLMAVILYLILFFTAGCIADFYSIPLVEDVTKWLSISIVIGSISSVHNAIMSRNLDFKKSFFRNISNILVYGIVAIILAYYNFGVWSLVYARILGCFVGSLVLCLTVRWIPSFIFSITILKDLFMFSSKILGSNLLKTLLYQINAVFIGKFQTPADLGYYQRGRQIPELVMTSVDGSLSEVMYPALSSMQDNMLSLKKTMRNSLGISFFIVCPILFFLFAIAEPLTVFLLTEKWLPSVPVMQLACMICLFWPLSIRIYALNAIGKSGLTLKLSLVGQVMNVIGLCFTVKYGILAMLWSDIFTGALWQFYISYYVNKYLGYSFKEMILDIYSPVLYSLIMCFFVYLISTIELPLFLSLILQSIVAVVTYLSLAIFFKNSSMKIFSFTKNYFKF